MSFRPYPNPGRALRQLDRHDHTTPPAPAPSRLTLHLARDATAALEGARAALLSLCEGVLRSSRQTQDDFRAMP